MKVKFLRDYHGPETNEFRHLQNAVVDLPEPVAPNFIQRKIVVSIEPIIEPEPVIEKEMPAVKIVEPKTETKRAYKKK